MPIEAPTEILFPVSVPTRSSNYASEFLRIQLRKARTGCDFNATLELGTQWRQNLRGAKTCVAPKLAWRQNLRGAKTCVAPKLAWRQKAEKSHHLTSPLSVKAILIDVNLPKYKKKHG
jgi:hypothetical protein